MRLDVLRRERGFSLLEVLAAVSIFAIALVPMLYVTGAAQRMVRSQSEATDLQQRVRVAAEKLQRDLALAGAGPPHARAVGPLGSYLPPIVPARTGLRSPDVETSAFADRVSIVYVPSEGWEVPLSAPMPDPSSAAAIDAAAPGCPRAGLCGFLESSRALLMDTSAPGAGYDIFTVTGATTALEHAAPNAALSKPYNAAVSHVVPVVQRVYYFDRPGRRLMLYDGYQSDLPFIDNVVDVRFEYFADASPGPGLRSIPLAELSDGPVLGLSPNAFDADLLSIRLVRVTLRLQVASDELRGTGALFARPGRSSSGYSSVQDSQVTFDVAPRNMRGSGRLP